MTIKGQDPVPIIFYQDKVPHNFLHNKKTHLKQERSGILLYYIPIYHTSHDSDLIPNIYHINTRTFSEKDLLHKSTQNVKDSKNIVGSLSEIGKIQNHPPPSPQINRNQGAGNGFL